MAKITLKGLYSEQVLGIFKVLRGYANLKDLAKISQPFNFESGATHQGYQREIDIQHAQEIKKYFESAKGNKFIPAETLAPFLKYERKNNTTPHASGE